MDTHRFLTTITDKWLIQSDETLTNDVVSIPTSPPQSQPPLPSTQAFQRFLSPVQDKD